MRFGKRGKKFLNVTFAVVSILVIASMTLLYAPGIVTWIIKAF